MGKPDEPNEPVKEKTPEEMEKELEKIKQEWDIFIKNFKDNPDKTVTYAEMTKVIDYISEDLGGLVSMVQLLTHNLNVLGTNFNQLVNAIQGNKGPGGMAKTKSGLILP
jgi:hypothetical protein